MLMIQDLLNVIWCGDFDGAAIGIARTIDFKTFARLENPFLPFNRNGVLFPKKIDGKYVMLSRPSDNGHTPFGDIFLTKSPDLKYWGEHRIVMQKEEMDGGNQLKLVVVQLQLKLMKDGLYSIME